MKSRKKQVILFWIFIIINFLLMISDGILTYIGTPDLTLEGNPLVSVLEFGLPVIPIMKRRKYARVVPYNSK